LAKVPAAGPYCSDRSLGLSEPLAVRNAMTGLRTIPRRKEDGTTARSVPPRRSCFSCTLPTCRCEHAKAEQGDEPKPPTTGTGMPKPGGPCSWRLRGKSDCPCHPCGNRSTTGRRARTHHGGEPHRTIRAARSAGSLGMAVYGFRFAVNEAPV
jgi:hypothetical protein